MAAGCRSVARERVEPAVFPIPGPAERGVDGSRALCRRPGVCRVAGCARWTAEQYIHWQGRLGGADDLVAVVVTGAEDWRGTERAGFKRTPRLDDDEGDASSCGEAAGPSPRWAHT